MQNEDAEAYASMARTEGSGRNLLWAALVPSFVRRLLGRRNRRRRKGNFAAPYICFMNRRIPNGPSGGVGGRRE
jgi:hypothetical protein